MANISFAEQMRRARIQNAMSQSKLGEKLKVSQGTISNWENGKAAPDGRQKSRVREILGVAKSESAAVQVSRTDLPLNQDSAPSPFGSWLNRARLEKRLSVSELATKARISAPAIYGIESGRIENPRLETVRRLEQALEQQLPPETKRELRVEATVEGVGEFFSFDPLDKGDWPDVPGIYVLYDISDRPIYVGQGTSIRTRMEEHEEKFWFKAPIVTTAAYIKISGKDLRRKIETILIRFLKRNAVINKQNVDR